MREGGAVVEMWPEAEGIWRCYEHAAEWAGLHYRCKGKTTIKNPSEVALMKELLSEDILATQALCGSSSLHAILHCLLWRVPTLL